MSYSFFYEISLSSGDLHAFLTNEDGKVILVGDPTRSDGMMALFAEALRSLQ